MSCYHTWAAEWKIVGGGGEEFKEDEEASKSLTLWQYQFNWLNITFGMILYYFFDVKVIVKGSNVETQALSPCLYGIYDYAECNR